MSLLLRSANLEKVTCSDNKAGSHLGRVLWPSWGRHAHVLTHAPKETAAHKSCHGLEACGDQSLAIERVVAGTSATDLFPAAPDTDAESPPGKLPTF